MTLSVRLGPLLLVCLPLWMALVRGPFWVRWQLPFGVIVVYLIMFAAAAVRETNVNHRKNLAGEIDR